MLEGVVIRNRFTKIYPGEKKNTRSKETLKALSFIPIFKDPEERGHLKVLLEKEKMRLFLKFLSSVVRL